VFGAGPCRLYVRSLPSYVKALLTRLIGGAAAILPRYRIAGASEAMDCVKLKRVPFALT